MVTRPTIGQSATVPPALLEDRAAVLAHLPKLMASQVTRLIAQAQRSETPLGWATLTVVLRPDPIAGYLITASAVVAE